MQNTIDVNAKMCLVDSSSSVVQTLLPRSDIQAGVRACQTPSTDRSLAFDLEARPPSRRRPGRHERALQNCEIPSNVKKKDNADDDDAVVLVKVLTRIGVDVCFADLQDMNRSSGSRVYVGGLLDTVRKEDLEREFSKYGKLSHVWVAWNPPGFAFIEFDDQRDAEEAVRAMNGQDVCGSRIRVELSRGRGRGGMRGSRGTRGGRGGGRGTDRGRGGGSYRGGGGRGMGRGRGMRDRDMSGRGGDRDRFDQYDSGDYYSRTSMSSSYRSRSPIGGRRDYSAPNDYSTPREYGREMTSQDGYDY